MVERGITMAVVHRGAIPFGLVHIPVGLYTATQDNDIHFNQLCIEDGGRVRYKKVCGLTELLRSQSRVLFKNFGKVTLIFISDCDSNVNQIILCVGKKPFTFFDSDHV